MRKNIINGLRAKSSGGEKKKGQEKHRTETKVKSGGTPTPTELGEVGV